MKTNLNTLFAAGGGDGPEAVTAALKAATDLVRVTSGRVSPQDWRDGAARMAILVADAPPHGIGEVRCARRTSSPQYGDGFPNGSPDNEDPIMLARKMAAMGISLFMVACEPALSGYQHAVDFYQGLVHITSGMLVPLTTASLLSHVVIAAAAEVMDLERLHREVGDAVLERLQTLSLSSGQGADGPDAVHLMDQVTHELHEKLMLRNESTKQLIIESIYRESEGGSCALRCADRQSRSTTSLCGKRQRICSLRARISRKSSARGSASGFSSSDGLGRVAGRCKAARRMPYASAQSSGTAPHVRSSRTSVLSRHGRESRSRTEPRRSTRSSRGSTALQTRI